MPKSWVEVRVEVPSSLVEGVSNFLIELGSPGVVQEDVHGPSRRKRQAIAAYFPHLRAFPSQKRKIQNYLSSLGEPRSNISFQHRVIREKKWAETWKSNFKPVRVTSRIVIKPPWERYQAGKGEIMIEIDPGMAFGTGTHPTTQMCLQALEELIPAFPSPPSVLDVGTGSGILAITAQKLGVKSVLALDLDPVAIESARKNATANQVNGGIEFRVGSLGGMRRVFDIVVANLLPQELLKVTSPLAKRISSRGLLIISGILRKQRGEIAEALHEEGLKVLLSMERKGWVCMVLKAQKR
jgi:ribosomal protein L11 methyltransferase